MENDAVVDESADTREFKILLDLPSTSPALGFEDYAAALAEIIQKSAPQFAVGIFGGWGSGKTTLMQAIEARLDPEITIPVRFSAWRYEKEPNLLIPLLDVIREALIAWAASDRHGREAARKTALTIGRVITSLVAAVSFKLGVPGGAELTIKGLDALAQVDKEEKAIAEEERPRSAYHAGFSALTLAFRRFAGQDTGRRIVVFIDDLDRCLPQGALEVLESMKLFFDVEGFVFVVGLDRAVVEWSVDAKYQAQAGTAPPTGSTGDEKPKKPGDEKIKTAFRVRGADYIKKIFQIPFQLRPVAGAQVDQFLDAMIRENQVAEAQRKDLAEVLRAHLPYLVTDSGLNPREVKRYINSYTLLRKIAPELDRHIVATLPTTAFRRDWEPIHAWIHLWRQAFIGALKDRVEGNQPTALGDLDPGMKEISKRFLEYVSKGKPGNALLHVAEIEPYIYSGEAIRPMATAAAVALIRKLAQLKVDLRLLMEINPGDKPADFQKLFAAIAAKLAAAKAEVDRLDQPYATTSVTAKLNELKDNLQQVHRQAQTKNPRVPPDEWLEDNEKLLEEAIEPLRDLL